MRAPSPDAGRTGASTSGRAWFSEAMETDGEIGELVAKYGFPALLYSFLPLGLERSKAQLEPLPIRRRHEIAGCAGVADKLTVECALGAVILIQAQNSCHLGTAGDRSACCRTHPTRLAAQMSGQ